MKANSRPWSFVAALILTIAACTNAPLVVPGTGLAVTALAGPTCPVETLGDPACAPRPVAGARVIVLDVQGKEVATVVLDGMGAGVVTLAAGKYVVRGQPAAGLMGTPEPMDVTIVNGQQTPVVLSYDTGIR